MNGKKEDGDNVVKPEFGKRKRKTGESHPEAEIISASEFAERLKHRNTDEKIAALNTFFEDRRARRNHVERMFDREGAQKAHGFTRRLVEQLHGLVKSNASIIEKANKNEYERIVDTIGHCLKYLDESRSALGHYKKADDVYQEGKRKGKHHYDLVLVVESLRWMDDSVRKVLFNSISNGTS